MGRDPWVAGDRYEPYIGRWSRAVAPHFVSWLGVDEGLRWADVGCGTGAVTSAVLAQAAPAEVLGVDPSPAFVAWAEEHVTDPRARFEVGDATSLPPASADVVVAGLVLNFVPDPLATVEAMATAAPGGVVAAYVWDYGDGMRLLKTFWDVAVELDPPAASAHEASRFALCRPEALAGLWAAAGLGRVVTTDLVVALRSASFDELWAPFLGGTGPAPAYVSGLAPEAREGLRDAFRSALPVAADGTVTLSARAYAVAGVVG